MAQQIINVGDVANDGLGDPIREAFIKTNENFTELYNAGGVTGIQNGNSNIVIAENSSISMAISGAANVFVVSETGTATLGTVTANAVSASGNVSGNYYIGNGRFLSGVQSSASAANLVGSTLSANVLYSNLTTVGILEYLSTTGNVVGTNGLFSGYVTVGNLLSVGSDLTVAGNINTIGTLTANNIVTTQAVQFPSLSLTGNLSAGNIVTTGLGTFGNVNVSRDLSVAGNITGNKIVTPAITGTDTTLTITGNLNLSPTGNVVLNNKYINNLANPSQAQDAATKSYVDAAVSGLNIHPAANLATTMDLATYTGATVTYNNWSSGVGATLTFSGNTLTALDGYPIVSNDRLLIKNEANAVYNGVYVYTSNTVLTRATDFDDTSGASAGSYIFVQSGSTNNSTGWTQTTPTPTIGTSNIVFTQFSGAGSYTAGTGLSLVGTQYSIANTTVTPGNYGSASQVATFTVNGQGQLTAAGNATITAAAASLTGTTLNSSIVTSSLTSTGTLNSLSVSGNVTSGGVISASGNVNSGSSINVAGMVSVAGNIVGGATIAATTFVGNGRQLTGLAINSIANGGASITALDSSNSVIIGFGATSTATFGESETVAGTYGMLLNGADFVDLDGGNLLNANVVNATTVATGSLTASTTISATGNINGGNLTVPGSITSGGTTFAGNLTTGGLVSAAGNATIGGNIAGGNILTTGIVSASGTIVGGNLISVGQISTSGDITGANVLTSGLISATANVYGNYFVGNGSQLTGMYGNTNVAAYLASGTDSSAITTTGDITGANVLTNGLISAAGGIISSANVYGNYFVGSISTNSVLNSGSNATGNIGSSTAYFNTFFGTATTALYADLAEKYSADAEYAPGTVLSFGGKHEVTLSTANGDRRVAGVVSTNPAHLMNDSLNSEFVAKVALTGRVPVSVVGAVAKGDLMVSAGNGAARAEADPQIGSVIGKSLENFNGESGVIEIVVGRV